MSSYTAMYLPQSSMLGDVVQGEFPALLRLLQTRKQPSALFLLRNVKKKLEHEHAIAREVALEATDVLEALESKCPS